MAWEKAFAGPTSSSDPRLVNEAAARSDTAILLRRMPLDVVVSTAVEMALLEGVQRDKNMRHSHVVNNLSMAGAVLSMLVNVSHASLSQGSSKAYVVGPS